MRPYYQHLQNEYGIDFMQLPVILSVKYPVYPTLPENEKSVKFIDRKKEIKFLFESNLN